MKSGPFRVLNTPNRVTAAVSMVTFGVGLGVGYLLGKQNRLEVEFHEIPDTIELDLTPADFSKARKDAKKKRGAVVIPPMEEGAKARMAKIEIQDEPINEYITVDGKVTPDGEKKIKDLTNEELDKLAKPSGEPVITSVFASNGPEWNLEHELKTRSEQAPYILHKDEFWADQKGYAQSTLTYYGGDAILVDEEEKPIYNHEDVTGPLKFGHGSGDSNVVYIRNDLRRAEYEVIFDAGLYSEEVLGLQIVDNERVKHIQHSKIRRFRPDRE